VVTLNNFAVSLAAQSEYSPLQKRCQQANSELARQTPYPLARPTGSTAAILRISLENQLGFSAFGLGKDNFKPVIHFNMRRNSGSAACSLKLSPTTPKVHSLCSEVSWNNFWIL